jgi:hypothetical protein
MKRTRKTLAAGEFKRNAAIVNITSLNGFFQYFNSLDKGDQRKERMAIKEMEKAQSLHQLTFEIIKFIKL